MTPCVWRILCLRNSSSVPYFRQPPNLPTAAGRNRKCTECGTSAFGRNRMSAESANLSTFGAETETEAEIRSTSNPSSSTYTQKRVLFDNLTIILYEYQAYLDYASMRVTGVPLTVTHAIIGINLLNLHLNIILSTFLLLTSSISSSSSITATRNGHNLLFSSLSILTKFPCLDKYSTQYYTCTWQASPLSVCLPPTDYRLQ